MKKSTGELNALTTRNFHSASLVVGKDGRATLSFDFTKISVPTETYAASHAYLREGPGHDVFLVFAQIDADSREPRHTLQIKFDDIALLNTWINSRDFFQRIARWYESAYGSKPVEPAVEVPYGAAFFQMTANIAFMGHNEASAVVAFYYFDPRMVRKIAMGEVRPNKELIEPVVQVKLTTLLVWNLLAQIERYVAKLAEKYAPLKARLVEGLKTGEAGAPSV